MLNNYDLVGGFPYIGNNHPNWLIFFGGVEIPNQIMIQSQIRPDLLVR